MGWHVAPAGTVTVSWLTVAFNTDALVAPKYTILAVGTELKPDPDIVTVVPIDPLEGEKLIIFGWDSAITLTHKKVRVGKYLNISGTLVFQNKS
jgi:hypothetical protein